MGGGGMLKMCVDPESPNELLACLRYMMNHNRHIRGRVDPEAPHEGGCV